MEYTKGKLESLFTSRNGYIISGSLSLISLIISLRGIFKARNSFLAIVNLANAAFSAYSIVKTVNKIRKG